MAHLKATNPKGFTLVEVLIVVIILGIFTAALLPRIVSVKESMESEGKIKTTFGE